MADYEVILQAAGGFGPYQIFIFFWSLFTVFTVAGQSGFLVFAKIPPCFTPNTTFFQNSTSERCNKTFSYFTMPDQLGLAPNEMHLMNGLVTVQMIGQLFGPPTAGYLSDRYGRRKAFTVFAVGLGTFGTIETMCSNWTSFMVMRFLIGICIAATGTVQFITASEVFTAKSRLILVICDWPLGYIFGSVVALLTKNWRHHELAISAPIPIVLLMTWFLAESPKWLMTTGRNKEAILAIEKIARWNRVRKSGIKELDNLLDQYSREERKVMKTPPFWHLLYSKKATLFTSTLLYGWLASGFVFYAMFYGVGSLSGNPALNTIYVMLNRWILCIIIPIIDRLFVWAKRKVMLTFGITLVMLSIGSILVVYFAEFGQTEIGKEIIRGASISALGLFTILWSMAQFLAAELFPTSLRNVGYGFCEGASRIGGILGPLVFELDGYPPLPYIISLVLLTVYVGALWTFVPETKGKPLPELPEKLLKKNEVEKNVVI